MSDEICAVKAGKAYIAAEDIGDLLERDMNMRLLLLLLVVTPVVASGPIRLERICHDGELVGLRIHSDGPVDEEIRWPKGICSQGDA